MNEKSLIPAPPKPPTSKNEFIVGADLNVEADIIFELRGHEYLRLKANGDIYVHGRPASTDKEVVDAMRTFLTRAKLI